MGVNLYTNSTKVSRVYVSVAGVPGVILQKEAVLLRAPLFKSELEHDAKPFRIASINDIPDYGFLPTPDRIVHIKSALDKAEKYTLQPWDVILTIVGTIGKIAIIPEYDDVRWVPSSNMFIVRFHDQQHDKAIAFSAFMRSSYGEDILRNLSHGTTISIVSKKQFSKIVIPYLTDEIKAKSQELFEKEQKLFEQREDILIKVASIRDSYLNTKN
jgi:hypothetical protein